MSPNILRMDYLAAHRYNGKSADQTINVSYQILEYKKFYFTSSRN